MKSKILFLYLATLMLFSCGQSNDSVVLKQVKELAEVRCYQYKVQSMKVSEAKEGKFFGLFDNDVAGYYNGHVDVGISSPDDISMTVGEDNSATVNVKISILNEDGWYIDGTPKYIGGDDFSNDEMKALDSKANGEIYQKFLDDGGVEEAKENMHEKLLGLLQSFGYDNIELSIDFDSVDSEEASHE